jgi:tetratricopeptide (TPR) repeat protein
MRKLFGLSLLFALLLSLGLMAGLPMTSYAIGEVTPTPSPDEDEEEPEEIDVEELLSEGIDNLQSGDFESAVENMDLVLEVEPDNATAYLIRGVANAQLQEYDAAIDDFTSAIEISPWVYDYYVYRGDAYRLAGQETDALLDYDTAIDINPLNSQAFMNRGDLYYELGDDEAGDFDDLMARAIESMVNQDNESALDFLSEAIDLDVEGTMLAVAYYNRGSTYMGMGNERAALEDYTDAIEADENMDNAYLARGTLYRMDDDLEAAGADYYQRIILKGDENVEESMEVGDSIEIEMAYRRVYVIEFEGEEGQEITLSASEFGDTATDPLIALLDPDGNPIAGDDDTGLGMNGLDAMVEDFELPSDGTYTLLVSHAEGGYIFGFSGMIKVEISD